MSFTLSLALGAFLIATWADARCGERRPGTLVKRFAHVIAACVVLQLATIGADRLMPDGAGAVRQLTAVFVLLFPALVYGFLSGLWLIRLLAEVAVARR
jgi:hypothetical protein